MNAYALSSVGLRPACRNATKAFFLGDELLGEGTPTANVSAVAARALGGNSATFAEAHSEDLYIAGLLHDIGKIILMERMAPRYLSVLRRSSQEGRPDVDVETEEFGFSHADIGSVLAIKWFLPEDLAIAIRYHHAPSRDPFHRSLSSLIHLADQLAWRAGNPSTVDTHLAQLDQNP